MNVRAVAAPLRRAGPVALALLVAAFAGWVVGGMWPDTASPPAYADDDGWPPKIAAERIMDEDTEIGEVLIDDEVIIALYAHSNEYTPYERAVVIAERLKLHLKPRDKMVLQTGMRDGAHVVLLNDAVLCTPLAEDLPEGMTLAEGAQNWSESLGFALGVETVEPEIPEAWEADEPYEDKFVPIVSLGKGKRIGGARVNGPASAVSQTQAVVQIEAGMLKWFEVQVYVPISTKVPGETLDRVQGVAVTAIGDLRL